jgi:hypothetical protein
MARNSLLTLSTIVLLALAISSLNVTFIQGQTLAPTWLKPGSYAEYTFAGGIIHIPNSKTVFDGVEFSNGTLRWECIDFNATTATLEINFIYTEMKFNGKTLDVQNEKQLSVEVYVDALSRNTYLQNGTLIGTTGMWLPDNPSANGEITLWDLPPDKINLAVSNLTSIQTHVLTPQGRQIAFRIEKQGNINGSSVFFRGLYDFDTGVMTQSRLEREPIINALGIMRFWINGIMTFSNTNIDLGPGDAYIDLRAIFTVLTLVVAFVIIFVAVYRRKTRRKH